jgi:hypothetical protein
MGKETEASAEVSREPLIGDEVIYLPDSSHQIVVDWHGGYGNLSKIAENADGKEVLGLPGTHSLEEIGDIVGHWDLNRIAEAWFLKWNLSEEDKIEFKRRMQLEMEAQERERR